MAMKLTNQLFCLLKLSCLVTASTIKISEGNRPALSFTA